MFGYGSPQEKVPSEKKKATLKEVVANLNNEVQAEKQVPYCTIFLVVASLTCHSITLAGNLMTCTALDAIGTGIGGWSKVGYGLGDALFHELDGAMRDTGLQLTKVVKTITEVGSEIDTMLSVIGHAGENAAKMNLLEKQNPGVDLLQQFHNEFSEKKPLDKQQLQSHLTDSDVASFMQINSSVNYASGTCASGTCLELKTYDESSDEDQDSFMQLTVQQQLRSVTSSENRDHEDVNQTEARRVVTKSITNMTYTRGPDGVIKIAKEWIEGLVHNVATMLDSFLKGITPCLIQIGKWVTMFSENIQQFFEQFSASIDKIEKLLDQVMHEINSAKVGQNLGVMVHQTFNIFDVNHTGCVTVTDLHDVAATYGVTFLKGVKSVELVDKFDKDKSDCLDKAEFTKMVKDPTVPGILVMVLRQYSHMLSQAAGNVKAARMRSEVATAVVQYLTLVSAKNYTKAAWVSQRLTNGSLPIAFTGTLLAEFPIAVISPQTVTVARDAKVIFGMMCSMNPEAVQKAFDYIAKPKNWKEEGLVPSQQPKVISLLTKWLDEVCPSTFSALQAKGIQHSELPVRAYESVTRLQKELQAEEHAANMQRHQELFGKRGSKMMLQAALGGRSLSATTGASTNPLVEQCINSGVPAVPATLEFASYLSNNATQTSHLEQQDCMDYYQDSSSPISSFANGVRGLCKKVSNFINIMKQYTTKTGIEHIEKQIEGFIQKSADEIDHIINSGEMLVTLQSDDESNDLMVAHQLSADSPESGVVSAVQDLLHVMLQILPNVVGDLKFARVEISSASGFLQTIFGMLVEKGPPIFTNIANLLTKVWTAYFCLFAVFQIVILFYGFWAGGFLGGPTPSDDDEYDEPKTFKDRCKACCNCCCILAGVRLLLSIMCNDITFLMEENVCIGIINDLKNFLHTFDLAWYDGPLEEACARERLLACKVISTEMAQSAVMCVVGSVAGAILSFQLIVEAGVLHERSVFVQKRRQYALDLQKKA